MSRLTGEAPVRRALLLAVLTAGAVAMYRRRGEVWHVAASDRDTSAARRGDEGP